MVQLVKNLPAMQETLVQFLGREDPLEKGYTTHSDILGLSLWVQLVKNPPARWETWVQSLGWDDPPEKGKATQSSILAWRIPWTIYSPWGHKDLDTTKGLSLSLFTHTHIHMYLYFW